jgi:autotransporter-associated beta strand protein
LFWNNLGSSILGETSNPSVGDGTTSWSNTERIWRTGVDPGSSSYDVQMAFSTGYSWNFGTGSPNLSQIDFRSVVTHELGHTVGFDSSYDPTNHIFASTGLTAWDKLLRDPSGNQPSVGETGTPSTFNVVANPVYFTGSNAVAIFGGNVPVYAPNPYQAGSSLTHMDSSLTYTLMKPALANGATTRSPATVEWAIMKDLGWSTTDIKNWTKAGGNLNWSNANNWNASGAPTTANNVNFTNAGLSSGDTIILGGDETVNALSIDSQTPFTIGGGSGTLNLSGGYITRSAASTGTQTIAQPLTVGSNTVWDIAGTGSLSISGSLSATNSITKISTGMVVLAGTANLPGNLILEDGDVTVATGGALTITNSITGDNGTLDVSGGTVNVNSMATNTGTFNVNAGTLTGSSVSANAGTFNINGGTASVTTDSISTGTLNVTGGTLTTNSITGTGTNATINLSGGALNAGSIIDTSTNGILNINGGTLNLTGTNMHFYGFRVGQTGVGTFALLPGKTMTSDVFLVVGRDSGGQGTFTNQGGSVNTTNLYAGVNTGSNGHFIQQASTNPNDPLPVTSVTTSTAIGYQGGIGLLEMKSGTFTTLNLYDGYQSQGTLTQTGGTINIGSTGTLELAYAAGVQGTYNLDGGTLNLRNLLVGSGSAVLNFGGGTIIANASFNTSVPMTLTDIGGEANIDTQSYNVAVSSLVAGNGGLNKLGSGTLTFLNNASYLGNTAINGGLLRLDGANSVLHAITGIGNLELGNGVIQSMLTADSVQVGTLTLGAGSILTIAAIPGGPLALSDNLKTIPEPATVALLASGGLLLGGLALRRWRQRTISA